MGREPLLRGLAAVAVLVALAGCSEDDGQPGDGAASPQTSEADAGAGDQAPGDETQADGEPPGDSDEGWITFESTEGGFRVALPVEPTRTEETVPTEIGPLPVVLFVAPVDETSGYNVGYTDYPEAVLDVDPDVLLDGAVQGAATNVSGTVEASTKLSVSGFPAVDYVISAADADLQARAILAGRRLYVLQRAGLEVDQEGFDRLVDSFELLDP